MARLRTRIWLALVRRAGWPPAAGALEWVRNMATYALGAGSASLHVEQSGEGELLRALAARRAGREVTIVDVGAHRGDYAVCARSAFGPQATLHCFEPQPETFGVLERRVGREPRTSCHRLGLGEERGSCSLFSAAESSAFTSLHEETFATAGHEIARVDEVEVRTLDDVASELGLTRIDLLKVDVEGHELAVLKGARGLLESGAIDAVQFEFGQRNLASRTFLLDFFELLGPAWDFSRVTPYGPRPFEYRPSWEVFVLEANYFATRTETARER